MQLTKRLGSSADAIDIEARTATFIFSSASTDRMGDIVDQKTWILDRYLKNPQFLWAHRSRDLPIGKTIKLWVDKGRLMGTVKFASAEENPFAETCWNLVKGGFLNAVSVGFIPHRMETYEDNGKRGYKLFDCELLECSLVPIPANQDALLSAKAAGVVNDDCAAAFRGVVNDWDASFDGICSKAELEMIVVKAFGDGSVAKDVAPVTSGTNEQPAPVRIDADAVYDRATGELIGVLRNGALIVDAEHQRRLAERNIALAEQSREATLQEVATKHEKGGRAFDQFFLRQMRRKNANRHRRTA